MHLPHYCLDVGVVPTQHAVEPYAHVLPQPHVSRDLPARYVATLGACSSFERRATRSGQAEQGFGGSCTVSTQEVEIWNVETKSMDSVPTLLLVPSFPFSEVLGRSSTDFYASMVPVFPIRPVWVPVGSVL